MKPAPRTPHFSWGLAGLALASLAACKGPAPQQEAPAPQVAPPAATGTAATTTGTAATPTGDAGPADTPPAKPDTGSAKAPKSNGLTSGPASPEIVAAARAIQKDLECMRGRTFKQDPKVAFQSLDDFRAYVVKQSEKELSGAKGKAFVRMLHALDAVDPSIDVINMQIEAAVGQAAAYYDPESNTFFVVQEMPEFMLNATMAHELQHALQDQHTDLLDDYVNEGFGSTDKDLATRFVVEGEATLLGHSWLVTDTQARLLGDQAAPRVCHLPGKTSGQPAAFWPMMREVVAEAARQTRDDLLNPGLLTRLAANSMLSEGMADSMEQLKALPKYFFYTLTLPYNQGGLTMYEHFAAGGYDWAKVDELFTNLPESSEQVLHPEKLASREPFLTPQLDEQPPFEGGPEAWAAWKSDPVDRLGELSVRVLLIEEGVEERSAVSAASGWNGDSIRVWYAGDQLAFDWKIAWDADADMQEFVAHLPAVVAKQRGASTKGLEGLDPKAGMAALPYSWTDSQGRARHGRISWSARELRWTDGWPAAVKMSPKGG